MNIPLKLKTWIRRGGNVGMWIRPSKLKDLEDIASILYYNNCSFVTIGHTSNIYFKNSFNIDYVLDTRLLKFFHEIGDVVVCECGVPMKILANYCVEHGYAGYEGMIDLPGTVGGAIVNNSGCYSCGVQNVLKEIDILTDKGNIVKLKKKNFIIPLETLHLSQAK